MKINNPKSKKSRRHTPEAGRKIGEENSLSRTAFLLFMFLSPLAVCPFIYDYSNLLQSAYLQVGSLVFLGVVLFKASLSKKIQMPPLFMFISLSLFVGWSGLSLFWAVNGYEGFEIFCQWLCCLLLIPITLNIVKYKDDASAAFKALFFSGTVVAIIGILQHLLKIQWFPQEFPPASTFANRNLASSFVLICLPAGAIIIFCGKKASVFYGLMLSAMLVFLFYTRTRSCWLALLVMLLFIALSSFLFSRKAFWTELKKNRSNIAVVIITVLVGVNLTDNGFKFNLLEPFRIVRGTVEKADEYLQREGKNAASAQEKKKETGSSEYFRLAAWRNSVEMIREHPVLGIGLGNLRIFYPVYRLKAAEDGISGEKMQLINLHNDFLQILVELGLSGFLLLTSAATGIVIVTVKAFRKHELFTDRFRFLIISSVFIGYSIVAFFDFPNFKAIHPAFLAVYAALFFVVSGDRTEIKVKYAGIKVLSILTALVLILLVFCSIWNCRRIIADYHFLLMKFAADNSRHEDVIREGDDVLRFNSNRTIAYSYQGKAYVLLKLYDKGIERIVRLFEYYPYHETAWINLGYAYSEKNDLEKAMEVNRKALSYFPDSASLHNNLGNALVAKGQTQDALVEFNLACRLDKGNHIYLYNKGIVEMNADMTGDAEKSFRKATRMKPGWDPPGKQLEILTSRHKANP